MAKTVASPAEYATNTIAKQGYRAEKIAIPALKKQYAPCLVVKLVIQKRKICSDRYRYELNLKGLNDARKKLFKKDFKKNYLFEKRFTEFMASFSINYSEDAKCWLGVSGLPDFIILKKNSFRFVEVKSYEDHRVKEFLLTNRLNLRDTQRRVFPKLAGRYKLDFCIVRFFPKPKKPKTYVLEYRHVAPLLFRKITSNMSGLSEKNLEEEPSAPNSQRTLDYY